MPFMRSLRTWDARKTRTLRGVIGTSIPVFGLRPTRFAFLTKAETAERGNFNGVTFDKGFGDFIENGFDKRRRLVA